MTKLTSLKIERIADTVREQLRELVLDGSFVPGQKIPVDQVAAQLGISQSPVRAAVNQLVSEGLLRTSPRRGTYVTEITERAISESLSIRSALEKLAAETLLDHVTVEDQKALQDLADRVRDAKKVDEHFRCNMAFHEFLVRLGGNALLIDIYRRLNAHIHLALVHSRSESWKTRIDIESIEHQAIVDAISGRQKEALQHALDLHLRAARESLLNQLQNKDLSPLGAQ